MHSQVNCHLKTSSIFTDSLSRPGLSRAMARHQLQNESHQLALHLDSLLRRLDAHQIQIEAVWLCFILRMEKPTGSNIELKWDSDLCMNFEWSSQTSSYGVFSLYSLYNLLNFSVTFLFKNLGSTSSWVEGLAIIDPEECSKENCHWIIHSIGCAS